VIVVHLAGGLGNQMLQYATGRALSLHLQTPLKLDKTRLVDLYSVGRETPRRYELGCFPNLDAVPFFRFPWLNWLPLGKEKTKFIYHNFLYHGMWVYGLKSIIAHRLPNPESVFDLPDNIYLQGNFFSIEYFKNYWEEIQKDFTFPEFARPGNIRLQDAMKKGNSVSVHIRRTDYLKAGNEYFSGVCTRTYYLNAFQRAEELLSNPHYYIFGDDMVWGNDIKVFPPERTTFVQVNAQGPAFRDLQLMANCQVNIISNSSFSWWAAQLNNWRNKQVIVPNKWFSSYQGEWEKKIVNADWIRIATD